ncbi:glycosyltransferase [bacterium]|nr:glycosyltransferase [bacterium]
MTLQGTIDVTVAVVTYNEKKHIEDCIRSVCAIHYPAEAMEILVVDGCSTDGTQDIVRRLIERDARIRLVENPGRTVASNRNTALSEARHPFVAFTDADCEVPADWLSILTAAFRKGCQSDETLAAVGGANVPPPGSMSRFLQALGIMLNTFAGSLGSVQGKVYDTPRTVDSLACLNVLYDRERVLSVGGYDEDMKNIGEDAEMHFRLRKAGYRLLYIPESTVFHKLRPTPVKWARNMFNYGRGRVVMSRKHRELLTFRYMLPLFFLAAFAMIPLVRWSPVFLLPLAYFPVIFVYSVLLALFRQRPRLFGWITAGFIITHWCYALGMMGQILSGKKTM